MKITETDKVILYDRFVIVDHKPYAKGRSGGNHRFTVYALKAQFTKLLDTQFLEPNSGFVLASADGYSVGDALTDLHIELSKRTNDYELAAHRNGADLAMRKIAGILRDPKKFW
jgi:hypothetical protein